MIPTIPTTLVRFYKSNLQICRRKNWLYADVDISLSIYCIDPSSSPRVEISFKEGEIVFWTREVEEG
jgi:hypothetical protein